MTDPDFTVGPEVRELYESDKVKLRDIARVMHDRYRAAKLLTPVEETARRASYAKELAERIAEVGFSCDVLWEWESEERDPTDAELPARYSPCCSDDPDDNNVYYLPQVIITGRVDILREYDHDRQKHEVRGGVFDGVSGVIDPNTGLLTDDARRKDIY